MVLVAATRLTQGQHQVFADENVEGCRWSKAAENWHLLFHRVYETRVGRNVWKAKGAIEVACQAVCLVSSASAGEWSVYENLSSLQLGGDRSKEKQSKLSPHSPLSAANLSVLSQELKYPGSTGGKIDQRESFRASPIKPNGVSGDHRMFPPRPISSHLIPSSFQKWKRQHPGRESHHFPLTTCPGSG